MLYSVFYTDAASLVLTEIVLVAVSLLACVVRARRAGLSEPVEEANKRFVHQLTGGVGRQEVADHPHPATPFLSHIFGDQPMSSRPASPRIIYLGLDVHKDSVTIAVLPADAKSPTRIDQYPNDVAKLRRVLERHAKDGEIRACYEASGAGYVLQRAMQGWGYHGDIIAPSLIPTKPGVQRKHDQYDASQLARGCIAPVNSR